MRITARIGYLLAALLVAWGLALGPAAPRASAGEEPPGARPPPLLVPRIGHAQTLTSLAVSADGRWVLTGSFDHTACLWDRTSGSEVRRFTVPDHTITAVAISPDGRWVLTGSTDRVARLWELESGREVLQYKGHGERIASVAFAADGASVLTGSWDKTARVWDRASGRQLAQFNGHTDRVVSARLSRDGAWALTASSDRTARLWERASGRQVKVYTGHEGDVTSAVFAPDERSVLTASADKSARLWDRDSAALIGRFDGHRDKLTCACFSPDGRWVLTGSWDHSARLWDSASRKEVRSLSGHTGMISGIAFTPDGTQVVTSSYDLTAGLWDRESGTLVRRYEGRASAVTALAVARDLRWLVTGGADGVARLWDREGGKEVQRYLGHTKRIAAVALSPDGLWVLTGSEDGSLRLWARESGKQLQTYTGHSGPVAAAIFVGDGSQVLSGSDDRTARLWDRESGRLLRTFTGHADRVSSVAATADGRFILTGGHDRVAILWDSATQQARQRYAGHTSQVSAVAFSPNGSLVATGGNDKVAHVWERDSARMLRNLVGHGGWIASVAFAPNERSLLTGSLDGSAALWSLDSDAQVRRYVGHTGSVSCVAFAPQGDLLLTGSADSTTRVWNKASGANLCTLISFKDGSWAAVDPQGRYDASNAGRIDGLHWVVGQEVIALEQLQSAYYEPGLLTRVLRPPGGPPVARLQVPDFARLGLFPQLAVRPPAAADGILHIGLSARGGGIGKVVVKIDGATVSETKNPLDAQPGAQPSTAQTELTIPLANLPQLAPGRPNRVTVEVYNAEGSLRSRGVDLSYTPPGQKVVKPPEVWGVIVGVSSYASPALQLRYSAKDAEDISHALQAAAQGLFGKERTHIELLCTCTPDRPPLRSSILAALIRAQAAAPDDIFVLYLAGHGVTHGTPPDYYFLTQEATSQDMSSAAARESQALSAAQFEKALSLIPARRRLLIFDTCRAGTAGANLARQPADDPSEQKRVMARVQSALGTYVLAGCAADAVSYEANQYSQGLLTYALLEAMKLGLPEVMRDDNLIDVSRLLAYAQRRVPELAKGIGGIQEPQLTLPEAQGAVGLGRLTPAVKQAIRLGAGRALFGQPELALEKRPVDPQKLTKALKAALVAASNLGAKALLNYVDQDAGEGLIIIRGFYSVTGEAIQAHLFVHRETSEDPVELGEFEEAGSTLAIPDLASRIVTRSLAFVQAK